MIDASELLSRAQPFIGWKASGISAMVEELCAAVAAKEAATKEAIEWLEAKIADQMAQIELLKDDIAAKTQEIGRLAKYGALGLSDEDYEDFGKARDEEGRK
jgi:hypothetical protein